MDNQDDKNSLTSHQLAIIDYGMGNLHSVARAWEHVGARVRVIQNPDDLGEADALVFPGQGAIVDAIRRLRETGFDALIRDWIAADRPFFGICLGLQALFEHSEEGDTPGLGIFPGRVRRFTHSADCKVPHMGWNTVQWVHRTPLDHGLHPTDDQFYFVHSYYVETPGEDLLWGRTEYAGVAFLSALRHGNCYATQFHPEKSQSKGLHLYRAFLETLQPGKAGT